VRLPVRRFGPTVERSIAKDLGRLYGLRGWDVIAIVRKFEAALLAMAETPGAANGLPNEHAKKRDPPKDRLS
jgi:hypothetical protein